MPANLRMKQLYDRLALIGIDKSFLIKVVLPDWWDDEMAATDAGYSRGLGIISSHLGLDLRQLWNVSSEISVPSFGKTNFKLNANLTETDVRWAKCVALSAAGLAVRAMQSEYKQLPAAKTIRDEILAAGAKCVNLRALLAYLWEHGVPVIFVDPRSSKLKKMDGIAAKIDGRPVIVISKKKHLNSLMVFNVAHEVGHIVRGHLEAEPILVDTKIDRSNDCDQQEKEANQSALELLTGSPTLQFQHHTRYVKAEKLAEMAVATATTTRVDAGVIAQNFAYGRIKNGIDKRIMCALANKACTIIEGDKSPVGLIEQVFLSHTDCTQLSEEDAEFLMKVAVSGEPNAVATGH